MEPTRFTKKSAHSRYDFNLRMVCGQLWRNPYQEHKH